MFRSSRKRRPSARKTFGDDCIAAFEQCNASDLPVHRKQMAEHVAGATMAIVRGLFAVLGGGVVVVRAVRDAEPAGPITMRSFAHRRLPRKGRRSHRREHHEDHQR